MDDECLVTASILNTARVLERAQRSDVCIGASYCTTTLAAAPQVDTAFVVVALCFLAGWVATFAASRRNSVLSCK